MLRAYKSQFIAVWYSQVLKNFTLEKFHSLDLSKNFNSGVVQNCISSDHSKTEAVSLPWNCVFKKSLA